MMTQAERIATLESEVRGLREDVGELTTDIKELTAALNQGRGGLAAVSFLIGGSLITLIGFITGVFK